MAEADGEATVCGIYGQLLTSRGKEDTSAQEEYQKHLGKIYPTITLNQGPAGLKTPILDIHGNYSPCPLPDKIHEEKTTTFLNAKKKILGFTRKKTMQGKEGLIRHKHIAWHHHRQELAIVVDVDRILLLSLDKSRYSAKYLVHTVQSHISTLQWRPNASSCLAVACSEGICIWRMKSTDNDKDDSKGSLANASMEFLQMDGEGGVTALAWDPEGRRLASASRDSSAITIWDVALGVSTQVVRDLDGTALLSWSPTGDHLVSAKHGGNFHLWETSTWTSERWDYGRPMVGSSWSSDGRMVIAAFEGSTSLQVLYLGGDSPSSESNLIPLELPGLLTMFEGLQKEDLFINAIAWDPSGDHLAVSLKGHLALYDVRMIPIPRLSPLGLLKGPSKESKALAFDFHPNIPWGALLAVKWSTGQCQAYPLILRSV